MKEVETDMREAAVRYFEGCLSAQDEERLYRFIQESGGNYSFVQGMGTSMVGNICGE